MNNFKNKGDILLVDDVPENLQLLFTMLTEQGYEVRRVLNGKQALNAAITDPPDLILLDIKMPDLDGYQVCEQLKSEPKTKHIPVIFLSALNEIFDKVKAFDVGGADYITKPFQLQDVLIRVENQLNLLNMQKQLEAKNESLTLLTKDLEAFSYRISHDLSNNIYVIKGYSYLLKQKYAHKLDEKGQKYIQSIYQETLRMQEILEDLLRLSQCQQTVIRRESFNLSEMIKKIIEKLNKKNDHQHREFIIAEDIHVKGDQRLLKIALENLLSNAVKYTAKKEVSRIEFGHLKMNSQDVYFIKDNGVGFEPETSEQLFTPFQRLHSQEEFSGTGIGLATVQRIIQRHGGKIWYEAQVNQGATFYFTLES